MLVPKQDFGTADKTGAVYQNSIKKAIGRRGPSSLERKRRRGKRSCVIKKNAEPSAGAEESWIKSRVGLKQSHLKKEEWQPYSVQGKRRNSLK